MFQRILVPLDGSVRAEQAIPVAIRLARASGGTVIFVHIVLPLSEVGEYGTEEETMAVPSSAYEKRLTGAAQYLQHIIQRYASELDGVHIEQEVDTGARAATIFSVARLEQVDLIVMCSHGAHHLFHWIFRSVAREAVHHCPVPILVLKESESLFLDSHQTRPIRILIPLDGSPLAEEALQPALQFLTALTTSKQGEVRLVQIVDLPSIEGKPLLRAYELKHEQEQVVQKAEDYLKEVAHRLSEAIPAAARPTIIQSVIVSNHVARTIAEMAEFTTSETQESFCNFLVMATHGRTGFQRLRLGSVTEQVLGATDLPLLIVRPSQPASQYTSETKGEIKIEIGTR